VKKAPLDILINRFFSNFGVILPSHLGMRQFSEVLALLTLLLLLRLFLLI
jgi:hypothetical protein